MEIMVEICGSEGSAHITEIHDKLSLNYDFSDVDVDEAIALLLSSDSITKIGEGEDEYEIKKDIGRKKDPWNMLLESDKNKFSSYHEWFSGYYETLAMDVEKKSEMQIGNQLQSVFEKEIKKGHWPMKSMKQKIGGEVPTVKWKIHELVMEILWSNYQAESDEATLESGESEDFQYKAPGYLPTSQITSGLKSKYGVEKSDGRISQVLGDLCGLGVFKSEKVKGSRGKKYKLTTKGKVMMKGNRFSITPSGDIVATT